jgi:hypothetical protein
MASSLAWFERILWINEVFDSPHQRPVYANSIDQIWNLFMRFALVRSDSLSQSFAAWLTLLSLTGVFGRIAFFDGLWAEALSQSG